MAILTLTHLPILTQGLRLQALCLAAHLTEPRVSTLSSFWVISTTLSPKLVVNTSPVILPASLGSDLSSPKNKVRGKGEHAEPDTVVQTYSLSIWEVEAVRWGVQG